jgi:hypothetical protein
MNAMQLNIAESLTTAISDIDIKSNLNSANTSSTWVSSHGSSSFEEHDLGFKLLYEGSSATIE